MSPLARRPAEKGGFSTLRRVKIRRPSLPTKRKDPVSTRAYGLVMNRDGGCVLRGVTPCAGRLHWHHRQQVKHGGPSTVANGVTLCDRHHKRVHDARPETTGRGLLLTRYDEPALTPVTLSDGRTVWLTTEGTYREAEG